MLLLTDVKQHIVKSKKRPSARLETWEEPYLYNIQACNVKSALAENDQFLT